MEPNTGTRIKRVRFFKRALTLYDDTPTEPGRRPDDIPTVYLPSKRDSDRTPTVPIRPL